MGLTASLIGGFVLGAWTSNLYTFEDGGGDVRSPMYSDLKVMANANPNITGEGMGGVLHGPRQLCYNWL